MLRELTAKEVRDVFLRQAKSEELIVVERNQDMLLWEMGVRDDYVRLPTGYLTKKDNRYGRGRGGWRGRGGNHSYRGKRATHLNERPRHGADYSWGSESRFNEERQSMTDVPVENLG